MLGLLGHRDHQLMLMGLGLLPKTGPADARDAGPVDAGTVRNQLRLMMLAQNGRADAHDAV